jgi:F-type H+-transporting ATPase subunit delta
VEALHESEELQLFFYGGQIPEREKRRAIDALTEDMALSTRNFLKILSDNGREEILEVALLRYEELVKEHLGRIEVEVTTAVELSDEELDRLRERIGKILEGREVILHTSVSPELLGGAVFRFGGRMLDSSVRGQLLSLREEMLERSVV